MSLSASEGSVKIRPMFCKITLLMFAVVAATALGSAPVTVTLPVVMGELVTVSVTFETADGFFGGAVSPKPPYATLLRADGSASRPYQNVPMSVTVTARGGGEGVVASVAFTVPGSVIIMR